MALHLSASIEADWSNQQLANTIVALTVTLLLAPDNQPVYYTQGFHMAYNGHWKLFIFSKLAQAIWSTVGLLMVIMHNFYK
jgi:hypothetical protein